ncbi:hypothetical protein EPI10_006879 [Gossypium australe]|uniref:Uncharacterized protein n=1 Tax=Gossypium australe TaxID=47621 RepID=A0A5B6WSD7_9ROSI|nr:hypothetical protein EPI10_006879 [Gossypium australe]
MANKSSNFRKMSSRSARSGRIVITLSSDIFYSLNFTTTGSNNSVAQSPSPYDVVSCVYCGDCHSFDNYPSNHEFVSYVRNQFQNRSGQGPQSNFYNPS